MNIIREANKQERLAEHNESKAEQIDRVKAGLPLPEQPVNGAAPDFNSMDGRLTNVGSGGVNANLGTGTEAETGLRGPATKTSDVRVEGGPFDSGVPRSPKPDTMT